MIDAARSSDSRKIIGDLLEAEDLDDAAWLARAREVRASKGLPIFSELLRLLTHLRFSEPDAEDAWRGLLAHRRSLAESLGRDPGLRVATFDWFVNVDRRLKNPKVLEIAQFDKTEKSAMTDWLTGLYNKGAFRTSSLRELRRAQRYRQQISFLLFDVDDFKEINDGFGHDKGDAVLRETSRLLRQSVRDVDICARYGGDEFAVLLPETGRGGAAAVAHRITRAMSTDFSVPDGRGGMLAMSFSGGLSVYPEDGDELGELLRRADSALYQAKGEGKNRIVTDFVERRLAKRYDLTARNLTLTLRRDAGRGTLVAKLKDISRTGFGLTSEESLDLGESVEISLDRPERRKKKGGMLGRVVRRASSTAASGQPGFFVGVDLEEGSRPAAESTIEAFALAPGADDPGEGHHR